LRGVAAIFVVFFHVFVQLNRIGYSGPVPQFLNGGVDIFFIISGFIMWHTTFGRNVGTVEFLTRRFIRIVPLYWLITTFYLIILLIRPNWMYSARFDFFHIVASYLFIPAAHPFPPHFMWPLVVPGWTLNYEMFFYLLFGLALLAASRMRAAIVVATLVCIVSLRAFDPPLNSVIGFYSSSITLEFAFGVLLGYLFTSELPIPRLVCILVILAGFVGLIIGSAPGMLALPRALIAGVPALFIVAGAVFFERTNKIAEIGLPKLLGDSSYSIYLSHGATLSAFGRIWSEFGPDSSKPLFIFLFSLSAIIVATTIGIGVYLFIERPLLRTLSKRVKQINFKAYRPAPSRN